MDSTGLLNLFRSDTKDVGLPTFWSDAEIYSYIDDAQKMFCRLQGGFADATSSITRLTITAGNVFIPISPLILKLREVRRTADNRELRILNFEDLQSRYGSDDYGYNTTYYLGLPPGDLKAVVVGVETNKIKLIPTPVANQTLDLIVYRLPLTSITGASQTLEVDEQHHRHLMLWMKHLAHLKQDAETYDRGRSDVFKQEFENYCDQAKRERERREHKYRTVSYGGY